MSARREIAVNWEAERYKEVWREGCRDIRRRGGLGWWGFRLYLRHGGVHHYSEQRFDVEAGWISGSRREAVLIKTVTMQPELPRRNGGFEESLNAPFRAGCPQITPDITLTDSEASVAKCVFFTTIYETFLSVCVCVCAMSSQCPTFWVLWWRCGSDRSDRLRWAVGIQRPGKDRKAWGILVWQVDGGETEPHYSFCRGELWISN